MIIATAGHVDHGKTTLVRALSGIDTDRLPEEQRRGMSIDIGLAHFDLGTGAPVGLVDVPGHERFLRNMLAGVAAIDLALLVVAADDGPMPQTREHLAILRALAVPRLAVALTKTDRVSPERLAQAQAELAALLAPTPWADAPVWPVAAPSGAGVAALRQGLAALAQASAPRPARGRFRLAVDRSFAVAGAGRVVTGVVLSGTVQVGDAVVLSPHGTPARVRGLQVHHASAQQAQAGQRCALNLAGLDGAPVRGDWVLDPAAHAPTDRLDVRLATTPAALGPGAARRPWLLHLGAAAVPARLVLLAAGDTPAGTLAQLVLAAPVAALRGDRFVLRDPTAQAVLVGGEVLDPWPPARGRASPQRLTALAGWAQPSAGAAWAALLVDAPAGLPWAPFAQAWNLDDAETAALLAAPGQHAIDTTLGVLVLAAPRWQQWLERVTDVLVAAHRSTPDGLGLSDAALRATLVASAAPGPGAQRPLADAVARAAIARGCADGAVVREGLHLRLPGHRPVLAEADAALLARVTALLAPAGLRPPIVGELATALGLPLEALRPGLQRLGERGLLVPVAPNRWYLPATVPALHAVAQALAAESPDGRFDAAAYRDRSGIGRNLTVQVLEFLDRVGLTRFDGSGRRVL